MHGLPLHGALGYLDELVNLGEPSGLLALAMLAMTLLLCGATVVLLWPAGRSAADAAEAEEWWPDEAAAPAGAGAAAPAERRERA